VRPEVQVKLPRVQASAKKPCILARVVADWARECDAMRKAVMARPCRCQTGGVAGPVVSGRRQACPRRQRIDPGQDEGRRKLMNREAGHNGHRSHDRVTIGPRGQLRQHPGYPESIGTRPDRPEPASILQRRLGLGVKRIELAGTSREEDQDDGTRPRSRSRRERRDCSAEDSRVTDLEAFTPR
jgi:hypothetical protein